jgi:glycosyltransferase involved in cell wall biosynthesis
MSRTCEPLVTVITVVRNNLTGLRKTAESVLSQTFTDFEWVVVDGYSTDGSYEFLASFKSDSRIRIFQSEPAGIYNAMNIGLTQAHGTWVWHINSGDFFLDQNALSSMSPLLKADSRTGLVGTTVLYFTQTGFLFSFSTPIVEYTNKGDYAHIHHQGAILRKKIAIEVGGYDETLKFAADSLLIDKIAAVSEIMLSPSAAVAFEMGGASSKNFAKVIKEIKSYRQGSKFIDVAYLLVLKNYFRESLLWIEAVYPNSGILSAYFSRRQTAIYGKLKANGITASVLGGKIEERRKQKLDQIQVEVLAASDLNEKYLGCIPYFIDYWNSLPRIRGVQYRPRVILVAESIPDNLLPYKDFLTLLAPHTLPTVFVAQTVRITEAWRSNADFVMISDIDMFPLNVGFETRLISSNSWGNNAFVILRDVLPPGEYPICYNIASPKVWKKILPSEGDSSTGVNLLEQLLDSKGGRSAYSGVHGGAGWSFDQQLLWDFVNNNSEFLDVVYFKDSQTNHHRLDRTRYRGIRKWLALPLVLFGYFHDFHTFHPIQLNFRFVNLVLKIRNLRYWGIDR